jgi:hypothetical protein
MFLELSDTVPTPNHQRPSCMMEERQASQESAGRPGGNITGWLILAVDPRQSPAFVPCS